MERMVWRLRRRPVGEIADGDLSYDAEPLPALQPGEFALETLYLSLDPTNRIWMSDMEQYMPPVEVGAPMHGGLVGRVVESRKDGVAVGDLYAGLGPWASHFITTGRGMTPLPRTPGVPVSVAFGVLGLVGPTAYFGLLEVGQPKAGETLVVSAASGGVGQLVGQIGKIKGLKVIGIAGGPEKCRYVVDELGFDAAIDYKNEDVGKRLDALAPDGVDINFEQVGGEIMEAVMRRMKLFGRMPLCGMISTYNDVERAPGPRAWPLILMRRLTVRGFIVTDFAPRFGEAAQALLGWIGQGRMKTRQDIRHGLENAVEVLGDLYTGGNFGKLLLAVHPDPEGEAARR
jgi:NADPH-dependent curcumin reductase CurA